MIKKTEGIVLKTLKFGETSMITTLYTREFGLKSFIVQGMRSSRGRKKHSYFQAMSDIEIVFYNKENRDLQLITETGNACFFKELQTHPVKIALGILVIEVFTTSVKEIEKNEELFLFLKSILVKLDTRQNHLIHVFLYFLVHFTRFLGFFPHLDVENPDESLHFNLSDGIISNRLAPENADPLLLLMMDSTLENCSELSFSKVEKRELIRVLFRYYQHHIPEFKIPASLEVFEELFS